MKITFLILTILLTGELSFSQDKYMTQKDSCSFEITNALPVNNFEELYVACSCDIKSFSFELYDKWGKLVYSTNKLGQYLDINIRAKVKIEGKEKPKYVSGTHFWVANYEVYMNDKPIEKTATGNLYLLVP